MVSGGVRSIRLEGFASIRSADVELHDLNVLVGANGSGKSNFVRALELLGRIVDEDLQFYVGLNGGASALLHQPATTTKSMVVGMNFTGGSYEARLAVDAEDGFVFSTEVATRGEDDPNESRRVDLGRGHRESRLSYPGLSGGELWVTSDVVNILRDCHVYHFHDTSRTAAVKLYSPTADNRMLRADAANLAPMLWRLRREDPAAYRRTIGAIRQVAPYFRDFVLEPEESDRIRLRWRQVDQETIFSANQMSDGTLRFVCLATLLLQRELPRLIVLDEPELGLHPYAIAQLAAMLGAASASAQVIVATQSVTLMTQFDIGDLVIVDRDHGSSVFSRPDPERLKDWLAEFSLGELWEKDLLGGRPVREGSH